MVLKYGSDHYLRNALVMCVAIGVSIFFVFCLKVNIYIVLCFFLLQSIIGVLTVIAQGRTLIFDKNGCTVCFFWYKKSYTWQELITKRIEKYEQPSMLDRGVVSYPKSAMFAPYKVRKPKSVRPWHYTLLHPLSFIYVNFSLDKPDLPGSHYEISEEEFWLKMKEWGISMS